MIAPDHGQRSADGAASPPGLGLAARASAGSGIARLKRADARGDFFPALAPAQDRPVAPAVRSGLLHLGDNEKFPVFVPLVDDMPHDPDCTAQNRHPGEDTPIRGVQACFITQWSERTFHSIHRTLDAGGSRAKAALTMTAYPNAVTSARLIAAICLNPRSGGASTLAARSRWGVRRGGSGCTVGR